MRLLGIDYGSKRIGLAVSDPLQILASPHGIVENTQSLWEELECLIRELEISLVVLGLPVTLKGGDSEKTVEVRAFAKRMKERLGIEPVLWDERFTSTIAHRSMLDSGAGKKKRIQKRKALDADAAAVMLQGYLDSHKRSLVC